FFFFFFFFFQAEEGIRDLYVTGVQTCALPIFVDVCCQIFASFPVATFEGDVEFLKDLATDVDKIVLHDKDFSEIKEERLRRLDRSEERRVGKECRSRWTTYQ